MFMQLIFSCLYAIVSNFNLQNYEIKNKLKILSNSEIENIFLNIWKDKKYIYLFKKHSACSLKHCFRISRCTFLCPHAKSLQSCPIMCDPMGCSLPGSSVHGILQARILEWVTVPSSRGSSWPRNQTHLSSNSCIGRWFILPLESPRCTSTKMYIH